MLRVDLNKRSKIGTNDYNSMKGYAIWGSKSAQFKILPNKAYQAKISNT
jgi:hypothetical protein